MNYIKLLSPLVKLKPPLLLNTVQPIGTARFSKFDPVEKFQKSYLQNDVSLSEQLKKFTTFVKKNEKSVTFNYKIGSKSILEQLKNTPLENIKACIKINDVVVVVRKDLKNSRTITLKLTKEYLKPVSRKIPISLKSPSVRTQALVMTNKEITTPFLNDTAKYLNLVHEYCTQETKVTKKVKFSEHTSQEPSNSADVNKKSSLEKEHKQNLEAEQNNDINNTEKHILSINDSSKKGNNVCCSKLLEHTSQETSNFADVNKKSSLEKEPQHILEAKKNNDLNNSEKHILAINDSLKKGSDVCCLDEEKLEETLHQKTKIVSTDNDITQYLHNATKYLSSLQDCCIKAATTPVLNCTKYITDRDIQLQERFRAENLFNKEMKNLLKKQKELSELCHPKKTDINIKEMFNKSLALEVNSVSSDVESSKVKVDRLKKPSLLSDLYQNPAKYKLLQMSLAAMISNSSNYNKHSHKDILKDQKSRCGHLLNPNIEVSNLLSNKISKKSCPSRNQGEIRKFENDRSAEFRGNTDSTCVIKKCLSAVRTSNKNNNLTTYLEKLSEKPTKNLSNKKIEEMVKNRENHLNMVENCNVECKSNDPDCNTNKPPNFTAKYKILKLSIGELLSNTDYLNKHPNTEIFRQCMQFADNLKKEQNEKNKFLVSNVPMAELISNRVRMKDGVPCLKKLEKNGKNYIERNNKKSVNFMSQEIARSDHSSCITQIGSKVPEYKYRGL